MPIRFIEYSVKVYGLHVTDVAEVDKIETALIEAAKKAHPNLQHEDDVETAVISQQGEVDR